MWKHLRTCVRHAMPLPVKATNRDILIPNVQPCVKVYQVAA